MLIESIEQANQEIWDRYVTLKNWATSYKVELPFDMLSSALNRDVRRPNPQYYARLSYKLGFSSVSTDISTTLLGKAGQCLIMAKLATWEEPIFYPAMASPLEKFDSLIKMMQEWRQIGYNY